MSRFCIVLFMGLITSCQSRTDVAAVITSDQLIASNSFTVPGMKDQLTKADRQRLFRYYPSTLKKIENNEPLSLQDVKNLTRSGVTDDVIIYEISATGSIFYLTPDDETELMQAGVSFRVIDAMKATTGTSY